jgi:hypothetical protein
LNTLVSAVFVLVPGHAFVGFYTDEGVKPNFETTCLDSASRCNDPHRSRAMSRSASAPLAGFEASPPRQDTLRSVVPRLDGQHRLDYALVDISTARAYGIMPLAVGRGDIRAGAPLITSAPVSRRRSHSHSP